MIFQTTLLALDILSNNAFAQSLHNQTLYEVVKQTSGFGENSQIDVGKTPSAIGIFSDRVYVKYIDRGYIFAENKNNASTVYVANFGSGTVSVISAENNTVIEEIPVGQSPVAIGVNEFSDTVYVVNQDDNNISVISAKNNSKIGEGIPVGDAPVAIGIDQSMRIRDVGLIPTEIGRVYVVNQGDNSLSVYYNGTNLDREIVYYIGNPLNPAGSPTAIGINHLVGISTIFIANEASDSISGFDLLGGLSRQVNITVGDAPVAIGVNELSDTVYVANSGSDSISVISAKNNTVIEEIPVGDAPVAIGVNQHTDTVYVANSGSDSISVISAKNNSKIGEGIPVGDAPVAIGVNELSDTVYVANSGSDSISVIDGTANKVVAGTIFKVNPFNSGYILCDGLTSPTEQYIYVYSGAQCTAKPNEGFEFVSWEENLEGNSTQLIKISPSASPLDSIADFFGVRSSDEPEAKLNVTKFGSFTANFKELPPAVPSEYWIPLYGIIISTIVGWSIPSIISWTKSKRDVGKLNYYHKKIRSLYGDGKLDENDIGDLDRLQNKIGDAYSAGKINEKHYESLRNETSMLYEEIFRKKIDSLNNDKNSPIKKPTQEQLAKIKNEIKYTYSKGKINEKHYDLLNKDISNLDSK